jgi:leucyl aminopeptidase
LGAVHGGIFANDDEIYSRFEQARKNAGEKFWRLPLDDEYRDMIKSNIADIVNSGGRWGGAVTAAKFLQEFVDDKPWIHLDIAGIAWMEENKPWIAKGPSGIAVRSVIEFVRSF